MGLKIEKDKAKVSVGRVTLRFAPFNSSTRQLVNASGRDVGVSDVFAQL
jgi:hypothetical protein